MVIIGIEVLEPSINIASKQEGKEKEASLDGAIQIEGFDWLPEKTKKLIMKNLLVRTDA